MMSVRMVMLTYVQRERSQWLITKVSNHILALWAEGIPQPLPCLP